MTDSREVEFFQISEQRNLLDEIADELTTVQMARLARQISRLKQYGWALDGSFFEKEKRNSIPKSAISTAESRLDTWRGRRQEQVKAQATRSPGNRGWNE